jgi:DNA-binding NarL/FixJ family response regulator
LNRFARRFFEDGVNVPLGETEAALAAPSRAPIRTLVADGSPTARSGVRLALENAGCSVCVEAADASAAIEGALREQPDVCLLDTDLPGDAFAAAAAISSDLPTTSVVMFASTPNESDFFAALDAGAAGYLTKSIDPERLATALQRVPEGEGALPRRLVARLIEEFQARERRRRSPVFSNLTGREVEVLELLSQDLTTAEIADRLFVARVTIRTHIASILKKLGVPDREGAVRLFSDG